MGAALPVGREILVPDELSVAIDECGIRTASGMVPALVYATQGLERHGQRELVFAVARTGAPAPSYPFTMARTVHALAAEGRFVGVGDISLLQEPGVDADARVTGFVYGSAPTDLPSTVDFVRPPLVALPLLDGETAVVHRFGYARLLTLLGAHARYYPFPWWFAPGRRPVVDDVEYGEATVVAQAPAYHLPTMRVVHIGDRLEIDVAADDLGLLRQALRDATEACALLPGLADVPKTYVWEPGQQDATAIVAPGGEDTAGIGCNYLLLVRANGEPTVRQLEDGMAVLLTSAMHARFRQAVEAAQPVAIELPGGPVRMVALRHTTPAPPVGYLHHPTSELRIYRPDEQDPAPRVHLRHVDQGRIVLLTSEDDLRRSLTPTQLRDFIDGARSAVDRLFASVRHSTTELTIEFRLAPGRPVGVGLTARPSPPAGEVLSVLRRQLEAAEPPQVRGAEIRFQLHLTLTR